MTYALYITYRPSSRQRGATSHDMTALADQINRVEGLISKVWIQNEEDELRGGFYFFDTAEHAEAWKERLVQERTAEGATQLNYQLFDVVDDFTAKTWHQPAAWQQA
ncbi:MULTISPECIES: YdhR family protein [unclassified Zymobacter]|uniref:YdhR family protein n=1 Tax=unclassified Zymobacter TaxID=3048685 RepID=UPI0039C28FF3